MPAANVPPPSIKKFCRESNGRPDFFNL
jgi:hypothetical protein